MNGLLFVLMGFDKLCAVMKKWRIPEKTLLGIGLFGGGFGGLLGLVIFNHKKRKHYFIWTFVLNIAIWIILYYSFGLESRTHGETRTILFGYLDCASQYISRDGKRSNPITILNTNNALYWEYHAVCVGVESG